MKAFTIAMAFAIVTGPLLAPLAAIAAKPNVVYLVADDLGWGDLSVNGGSIPTPRIDRLFKQGVRLDNFMGWCVCSPTRAMLLTGRHPFRVGTGPELGGEFTKEQTTIAEAFKAHGDRTGIFGKWHNGQDPDTPEYRRAFEEAWKTMPNKKLQGGREPVSWWHNREFRPQDAGYTEDFIVRHALEFIRDNKNHPFFCYVPFHIVHAL